MPQMSPKADFCAALFISPTGGIGLVFGPELSNQRRDSIQARAHINWTADLMNISHNAADFLRVVSQSIGGRLLHA